MWSLPDGEVLWSRDDVPTSFLATSPDGAALATVGFRPPDGDTLPDGFAASGESTVWDLRTGDRRHVLANQERKPRAVDFSPDSSMVAFGFYGDSTGAGKGYVVDVATGRPITTFPRSVSSLAFAPGGEHLVVADYEGHVSFHRTSAWDDVSEADSGIDPGEHTDMLLTGDGRYLLLADQALEVWEADRRRRIVSGMGLVGDGTNDALFLGTPSEGEVLYVASQTQLARIDMDPESWARTACRLAGRPLTTAEWQRFLPGLPYDPVCAEGRMPAEAIPAP
jgi:WD40 repeat protein